MVLCGKSNSDVNNYVLCGKTVILCVHIKTVQDENAATPILGTK